MSHNVETMAYTNEVPWHGLGEHVHGKMSVDQMLKAAKLNWTVERRKMFIQGKSINDVEVENFAALVRSSDNSVLDVVGSRYIPAQNKQVFSFFNEYVKAGKATMETMGSLQKGRIVWGLAALGTKFALKNNDVVKGYLLLVNYHQQGKANLAKFVSTRVVCNNTLTLSLAEGGNEFRMNHRNEFDEAMINKAKETLGIARDQLGEFEKNARLLQKLNISRNDAIKILAPIYQDQTEVKDIIKDFEENASTSLKRVMDVLEKAPGAQPDNGWGVLNAVTYVSDHLASRSADKRLTNAWLGKTARHKEQVLKDLLEMAS